MTNHHQKPVFNRVPQVTIEFWLVKLMAVSVGETAADLIADDLGFGLPMTSLFLSGFLALALIVQMSRTRYVPWIYWLTVVLVSVVGTLITDNLVDSLQYSLTTTTTLFALGLLVVFAGWFAIEKTLSIHTIFTLRREAFYWLAILFTFALGTSAGDQLAEGMGLGYLYSGLAYGAVIAVTSAIYFTGKLNGIFTFWAIYILTRPMGASFGDFLSQDPENGGIGLGTEMTSLLFFAIIAGLIVYMTRTHRGEETA